MSKQEWYGDRWGPEREKLRVPRPLPQSEHTTAPVVEKPQPQPEPLPPAPPEPETEPETEPVE